MAGDDQWLLIQDVRSRSHVLMYGVRSTDYCTSYSANILARSLTQHSNASRDRDRHTRLISNSPSSARHPPLHITPNNNVHHHHQPLLLLPPRLPSVIRSLPSLFSHFSLVFLFLLIRSRLLLAVLVTPLFSRVHYHRQRLVAVRSSQIRLSIHYPCSERDNTKLPQLASILSPFVRHPSVRICLLLSVLGPPPASFLSSHRPRRCFLAPQLSYLVLALPHHIYSSCNSSYHSGLYL